MAEHLFDAHMKEHIEQSIDFMGELTALALAGMNLIEDRESVREMMVEASRSLVARNLEDTRMVPCKVEGFKLTIEGMKMSIATMERLMTLMEGFDDEGGEY